MDFAVVGFEGGGALASSDSASLEFSPFSSSNAATEVNKYKLHGSTSLKPEITLANSEDYWKEFKTPKSSHYLSSSKEMRYSDHQHQQMISFSDSHSQMHSFPHYTSTVHSRIPGYGSEGLNGGVMHGMVPGMKGPFTPSQWMELEHQALVYKYITSNMQIPLPLVIPIQKGFGTAAFSNYPGLRYNTMGWGGTDPEPGRCRRTDGKKWRCARDAVANHKYCERHMNRGRHRSRKLVEAGGQSGNSVSRNDTGTCKLPLTSTNAAEPGNTVSSSSSFMNKQVGNLQQGGTNSSSASHHEHDSLEDQTKASVRAQDTGIVSRLPPTMSPNNQYSTSEHLKGTSRAEFGLILSDSVLNPLNKKATQFHRNNGAMEACDGGNNNKSQNSLHLFRDDWSRNRPGSSIADRTSLSISIPKTPSDYMSTTSSPNNEKFGTFPLTLLPELEATHMGLGMGTSTVDEHIPGSWKTPVGGPLGEALHITTNNGNRDGSRSSALNLMTGGWDSSSVASSPTGVLQKTAFGSVSNSSARSSPESSRGGSICFSGLFGSAHLNSVFQGL